MYEYFVRSVNKIVDGDTIDVTIDLGFSVLFSSRVRLAVIDTTESRTRYLEEKVMGLEAKDYLKERLRVAKKIVIRTEKLDSSEKYGRILGWLFLDGETNSVNNQMILKGYAWEYGGDTKDKDLDKLRKQRELGL